MVRIWYFFHGGCTLEDTEEYLQWYKKSCRMLSSFVIVMGCQHQNYSLLFVKSMRDFKKSKSNVISASVPGHIKHVPFTKWHFTFPEYVLCMRRVFTLNVLRHITSLLLQTCFGHAKNICAGHAQTHNKSSIAFVHCLLKGWKNVYYQLNFANFCKKICF